MSQINLPVQQSEVNSANSGTSSTKTSTISRILNEEQIFGFVTALRSPIPSKIINFVLFICFSVNYFANFYTWVAGVSGMEGIYTQYFANAMSLLHTAGIEFLADEMKILILVGLLIFQLLTVFLVIFGYQALIRGSSWWGSIKIVLMWLMVAQYILGPIISHLGPKFLQCTLEAAFESEFSLKSTKELESCLAVQHIIVTAFGLGSFILNLFLSILGTIVCIPTDPRQPFSVINLNFALMMMTSNQIFSFLAVLPQFVFLHLLAPIFSLLTSILGIAMLYFQIPFFSYVWGAIASFILQAKLVLSLLYIGKSLIISLNSMFLIIDTSKSSIEFEIFKEIGPIFIIVSILFGILGGISFLLWSGFLIWNFWSFQQKALHSAALENIELPGTHDGSDKETGKEDAGTNNKVANGKEEKKKKISYFHEMAIRIQFSHVSKAMRRKLASFLFLCMETKKYRTSHFYKIQSLIFAIFLPTTFTENESAQRVSLQVIERKYKKLGILNRFYFNMRKLEFENISKDEELKKREMYRVLNSAKKKQTKILETIQRIFKSMRDDHYAINSNIVVLKQDISNVKSIYGTLIAKYPENPEILRNYAGFLELVEGETDLAALIYDEAESLEEKQQSDLKKRRRVSISKKAKTKNSVSEKSIFSEYTPVQDQQQNNNPEHGAGDSADEADTNGASENDVSAVNTNTEKRKLSIGASAAAVGQKSQPKKEFMKKLFAKEDHFTLRMVFLLFPLLGIILLTICLFFTIYILGLQHIGGIFMKAKLGGIPYINGGLIRCRQIFDELEIVKGTNVTRNCQTNFSESFNRQTTTIFSYLKQVYATDMKNSELRKFWTSTNCIERFPVLQFPIARGDKFGETYGIWTSKIAFFPLTLRYAFHSSMIENESNNTDLHPLDTHIYYVMAQRYTIGDYAQAGVRKYLATIQSDSLFWGILGIAYVVGSIVFGITVTFVYCCMTKRFSKIRSQILALFKRIPRDTMNEIHEELFKQTREENSSFGLQCQIPTFCVIAFCLLIISVSTTSLMVVFGYKQYSTVTGDNVARKIVLAAGDNIAYTAQLAYYTGELVKSDILSTKVVGDWDTNVKVIATEHTNQYQSWNSLRFGYGLENSGIQGNGDTETNHIMEKDFSQCSDPGNLNCYSLKTLQMSIHEKGQIFLNLARNTRKTTLEMVELYSQMMDLTLALEDKMTLLMEEFTHVNELSKDSSLLILGTIGVCTVIIIFGIPIFLSMKKVVDENHLLRKLLRFVPLDIIETDEILRQFVYQHELRGKQSSCAKFCNVFGISLCKKSKKKAQKTSFDEDYAIIDKCNKAVIICTHQGIINKMNHRALQLFSFPTQNEMIGKGIKELVCVNSRSTLSPIIRACSQSGVGNKQNAKVDCVKRSGEKFPATFSVCLGLIRSRRMIVCYIEDITEEENHSSALDTEKANTEHLLLNIFPKEIAIRVKNKELNICEIYDDIACLCTDMVGFTALSSRMTPQELITMLSVVVMEFDRLTDDHDIEKIKTIGDAYIAVAGLHTGKAQKITRLMRFGSDMITILERYNRQTKVADRKIEIRIGISIGRITSGVIGTKKYIYDIWGDGMRIAELMEKTGKPNKLHLSDVAFSELTAEGTLAEFSKYTWDTVEVDAHHKKSKSYIVSFQSDQNMHKNSFDASASGYNNSNPNLSTHNSSSETINTEGARIEGTSGSKEDSGSSLKVSEHDLLANPLGNTLTVDETESEQNASASPLPNMVKSALQRRLNGSDKNFTNVNHNSSGPGIANFSANSFFKYDDVVSKFSVDISSSETSSCASKDG